MMEGNFDFVFCIDTTRATSSHVKTVKEYVSRFTETFARELFERGLYDIKGISCKFITFGDYKSEGKDAIVESPFFDFLAEREGLEAYIEGITFDDGCGKGANAYEAFYRAMCSDFSDELPGDRQIITLISFSDTLPLLSRRGCEGYPEDMPDMDGLYRTWMCQSGYETKLRERTKVGIIVAPPDSRLKTEIADKYNRTVFTSCWDDVESIAKIFFAS